MTKINKVSKLFQYQKKALDGGICPRCQTFRNILTVDHIIPISLLDILDYTGELKYEWEENFELICNVCNKFKGQRIDLANPKSKILLKKLVEKL